MDALSDIVKRLENIENSLTKLEKANTMESAVWNIQDKLENMEDHITYLETSMDIDSEDQKAPLPAHELVNIWKETVKDSNTTTEEPLEIKCYDCRKIFHSVEEHKSHVCFKYKCSECNGRVQTEEDLKIHFEEMHLQMNCQLAIR